MAEYARALSQRMPQANLVLPGSDTSPCSMTLAS